SAADVDRCPLGPAGTAAGPRDPGPRLAEPPVDGGPGRRTEPPHLRHPLPPRPRRPVPPPPTRLDAAKAPPPGARTGRDRHPPLAGRGLSADRPGCPAARRPLGFHGRIGVHAHSDRPPHLG